MLKSFRSSNLPLICWFTHSLFELILYKGKNFLRLHIRWKKLNYFSLRINKKFGEVPRNDLGCFSFWIIERAIVPEESKHRMCLFSIDFHLLHNREICLKIFLHKINNFFRTIVFLTKELATRERNNLKSILFPAFMGLDHFSVVFRGKPSLASYIYHHCELSIPQSIEVKLFTINIVDFKVEEALGKGRLQALRPWFEDQLLDKPSHYIYIILSNYG